MTWRGQERATSERTSERNAFGTGTVEAGGRAAGGSAQSASSKCAEREDLRCNASSANREGTGLRSPRAKCGLWLLMFPILVTLLLRLSCPARMGVWVCAVAKEWQEAERAAASWRRAATDLPSTAACRGLLRSGCLPLRSRETAAPWLPAAPKARSFVARTKPCSDFARWPRQRCCGGPRD